MDADDNPYVSCPYNKSHRVTQSRLHRHLIKCEQHYPKLWICPYNFTHRVPFDMKIAHCLSCPNKPKAEPLPNAKAAQIRQGGAVEPPTPIFEHQYLSKDDPDYECWD